MADPTPLGSNKTDRLTPEQLTQHGDSGDVLFSTQQEPDQPLLTSNRRKAASILLGFWYGGSLINGVESGLSHVLGDENVLSQWPVIETGVTIASAAAA